MTATNDLRSQHDESHEQLAAGFAVDALEPSERDQFRSILGSCAICAQLAAEYSSIAALFPDSLEPMEASPNLRQRVLDAATRSEPPSATAADRAPAPSSVGPGGPRPLPRSDIPAAGRERRFTWALPLAALITVVLGLGYWNYRLQQTVAEQAALIQTQHEVLAAVAAGGRQWALAGTPTAPTASGVLVEDPAGARPILLVHGLPQLSPRQAYQAWVITGGVPAGAGLLGSDGRGGQLARLDRPLGSADTVAVTVEPATGSPSPTGPIVVAGNL
jgi:anti-sigma-K factor RskA